jgi:putative ABC transport system permease protein
MGVAIGAAAIIGVGGVSTSSAQDLISQLDELSDLLTVTAHPTLSTGNAQLPRGAVSMVRRIGPVRSASSIGNVPVTVRRTDRVPEYRTLGINVFAAEADLLGSLHGSLAKGAFLNAGTARYPAVVLGSIAADRLGVHRLGLRVYLGGHWFSVVGVLNPVTAAPQIDRSALIGFPVAESLLGFSGSPSTIYVRANPDQIPAVRAVLAFSANPAHPEAVEVSRPSDALAARAAAKKSLQTLLLGLGALALLVGGIGLANVMFISVLERRSEIGIRRALGASKTHITLQFIGEAIVISMVGGVAGLVFGSTFTFVDSRIHGWPTIIPLAFVIEGFGAAIGIGVIAGIYPALRAARMTPVEALRAT